MWTMTTTMTHRPRSFLVLVVLVAMLPRPAAAEPVYAYRAARGDTLIGIGARLLRNPADWRELRRLNRITEPRRIPVGRSVDIPLRLLRDEPSRAEVVAVQGRAERDGRPARVGETVEEASVLATGPASSLTLRLEDGSLMTLQPDSDARVERLRRLLGVGSIDVSLRLERGRVDSRVVPQPNRGVGYRVHTPSAVVAVRGTRFRTGSGADGVDRAEVLEGTVAARGAADRRDAAVAAGYGLVVAQGRAAQPVPLLPAPSLDGVAPLQERVDMRLPFAPVAGAAAYRAQLATDADGNGIVADAVFAKAQARFAGLPDGDYWLRVRAIDGAGLEGRDAEQPLRLAARPEPPLPEYPPAGGKVRGTALTLRWSQPVDAAAFRVELAGDADFAAPLRSLELSATSLTVDRLEPGTYYWRLGAIRADGHRGPWGDASTVALHPGPGEPEPPRLDDDFLYLAWPGEPGQVFDLQLARDTQFTQLVSEQRVSETSLRLPRPAAGIYYMRVRATDPDGYVGVYTTPQRIEVPASPWWLLLLLVPLGL